MMNEMYAVSSTFFVFEGSGQPGKNQCLYARVFLQNIFCFYWLGDGFYCDTLLGIIIIIL